MHSSKLTAMYMAALALISVSASAQQSSGVPPARTTSLSQHVADVEAAAAENILTRAAYVRAVLIANPGVESAKQGWRAALARVRQAGAIDDPMIDVSIAPLSIGSSRTRFGYEVGIRQQLPWFGKRSLERDAMSAEAAASASDLETVRRELAMTAVLLYEQYFVAIRSLEINAQHVELVHSMRAAATAQFETGRGSLQDTLQAESELTHLEHDAVALEASRDVVTAQMNELLHRDPADRLPPPAAELATKAASGLQSAKQLQQDAIARRTEISSARAHARAQSAKADMAGREYYPTFTVSTSYSSMWDMPEHRWMIGVGLNIPLPTARRLAVMDEAHAARAQYESEVERLSDTAKTQVYVALLKVHEAEHVLQLFQARLVPVARQQVDAAQAGFVASQTPFMAVVEAEKNLRGVELDQKLAQAECDLRHAELERAQGRIPGLDAEANNR